MAGGASVIASQDSLYLGENNIYLADQAKTAVTPGPFGSDTMDGVVKSVGEVKENGAIVTENRTGEIFVPPYAYNLDGANAAMKTDVANNAGWAQVPFPHEPT